MVFKERKEEMVKARRSIAKMRMAVEEGERSGDPDRHQEAVKASRKPRTVKGWCDDWVELQETVKAKGTASYTENNFLDAMKTMLGEYHPSRLEKFRAAVVVRQEQDMSAAARWTQDDAFKRKWRGIIVLATKGYQKRKSQMARDKGAKPLEDDDDVDDLNRGAITADMAKLVCEHFVKEGKGMYAQGVCVAHGGLLRHGEIINAKQAHLYKENGKWKIRITGGKWRRDDETDYVEIEDADKTLAKLNAGKEGRYLPLFPGWDPKVAVAGIKAVARKNGWDPNRVWDFHALRHGKAYDNRVKGMGQAERMQRGRWRSAKIEAMYSRHR